MPLGVNSFGTFSFDVETGLCTCCKTTGLIYEIDETNIIDFSSDVLSKIDNKSKDQFLSTLYSTTDQANISSNIVMNSGTIIKEVYRKTYHMEDYERRSVVSLDGQVQVGGFC